MSFSTAKRAEFHPRNRHQGRYDFEKLIAANGELEPFVAQNKYGDLSIDFFDPQAVKTLNKALLALHYNIEYWEIPEGALTPPIPSRADYIHHVAELIAGAKNARCIDIGVGANCIYPIVGCGEYGWSFVGTDINADSIANAQAIVDKNPSLRGRVELRHQPNSGAIFDGLFAEDERFDLSVCNPPFHDSAQSAQSSSMRKIRNLKGRGAKAELNFGGQANELWCRGGELKFIGKMIKQSGEHCNLCRWFTTLVSNEDNLRPLERRLQRAQVAERRIIEMQQGNKRSRILAWRF